MNEILDERLRQETLVAHLTEFEPHPAPSLVMDLYSARNTKPRAKDGEELQKSDLKYYVAEKEVVITCAGATKLN